MTATGRGEMLRTGATAVRTAGAGANSGRARIVCVAGPLDGHDGWLPTTDGAPPGIVVIGTATGCRVRYQRRVPQACPREGTAWVYDYADSL